MWKHIRVWVCDVIKIKKMQEGDSMEQWFWPRSIYIMEPVQWRCHPRSHTEKFEEFCKPQANELSVTLSMMTKHHNIWTSHLCYIMLNDAMGMCIYDDIITWHHRVNTIKWGSWPLFIIGNADLKLLTSVFNLSASGKWPWFIVF